MTLGGSLSGPRWRPLSGLVLAPQLELFLARRHTGLVPGAGNSSYTLDSFEVPLLLRAELVLGGRAFYAMAGGYGSLLLRADETSAEGLMSPADMASRYDFGLLAAGGGSLASSSWGELSAEVRYQQGHRNLLPGSDQKHQVLSLLLGYGPGTDDSVDAPSPSSSDRWLMLKGGMVATRFQSPGAAASSFAPGFSFGGAFAPARFGSSVALVPQVELAFVHRGEHHGVTPAGSLSLDDVDVSAVVRGEAPIAGRALYGLAGVYGSVLIRAQRNHDGEITPMRDAVHPFDAGWLAGAGVDLATLGNAALSLEVRYQRGFFDRLSATDDAATLQSLTWALGITYGAPSTRPEIDPTTLYSANDQGDGKSAQRSGRTVSVRMARLNDRWLEDLGFQKLERSQRDGVYGYQATYVIPAWRGKDKAETKVLFWKRSEIDFDDSSPENYRGVYVPLKDGRLVRPTRITSKSLPDVHRGILFLEGVYAGQADGAIAAMEGFALVAGLGEGVPALRRVTPPRGAPRGDAGASSRASTSSAASGTANAFGGLSRASHFGIQPYNQLTKALKGTGLQAHHLIEKRFARALGQNARQMASIAVTKAEHLAFTNRWRALIPYGKTKVATKASVLEAARRVYANYPAILRALGL